MPSNATSELELLTRLIELQIPLSGVENAVFNDIASNLIDASKSEPALADAISSVISVLGKTNWMEQSEDDQLRQLRDLGKEPWFSLINFRANGLFFESPNVWALIGYDGPSIEKGGYKYNGFDDISWLPVGSK